MKTQQDTKVRMVALENLKAMCKKISGVCHRFWVEKVGQNRVYVCYSNPDEYGNEAPITAVFPCYSSGWKEDEDNPRVVLEPIKYTGGRDEEDWQAFFQLYDCPTLWRHSDIWLTHKEIVNQAKQDGRELPEQRGDSCVVCDLDKGKQSHN